MDNEAVEQERKEILEQARSKAQYVVLPIPGMSNVVDLIISLNDLERIIKERQT